MEKVVKVKSTKEMAKLGRQIGKRLSGGEVLLLAGSLGAGKTTLAKGILEGAGVKKGFSPTFILDATFPIKGKKNLKEIHHLDLYRLKDKAELLTLGVYDTVGNQDAVVIIEWADRFPEYFASLLKNGRINARIDKLKGNERSLYFSARGKQHENLLKNIFIDFNR
ncbi:MAG: tRNA (adenosine(37)-N6)-threonylcarbamoyltransferase complex ATPase subunit type 1 TsaE [Candidatus Doudnabacteria bacterium RIFCSPHIGHO2_02_FULL_46_11]|uniref:tRNA threonylcarbamoyladenosine biosynthesis protein TsaE n=1 Tax=Candidatus Doudnabacteria bacterium RIFCSPHIGHO2_02_FULL_46_11 TaxID=1817832 RepID=A0A1F5P8D6_9BACT|nr:MAG: tRNA (adenosine(37)-N6)-threonylcarbamoyltransferase complex ATPase subunit type 1 TsaE [Candidatus Doudnabacteria bacterium RIFCSPHIGHO2_02_FULL_46_11]